MFLSAPRPRSQGTCALSNSERGGETRHLPEPANMLNRSANSVKGSAARVGGRRGRQVPVAQQDRATVS